MFAKVIGKRSGAAIILLACLLLMAGCGANKNGGPAEVKDSGKQAELRTISDAYGSVQVPAKPARVVVLDIGALDNLLALGIKPVGAPSILTPGDPYPKYLGEAEGIANIGSVNEPNMEKIDSLRPDLIIGNKDTHSQIHDKLAKIAPTVFVETLGVTWKKNLQTHAEAVGKGEEGKKLLDDYQKRTDELKKKIGTAGPKVSVIRTRADKAQIYLTETFSGVILADAGIVRPEAQRGTGFSKDVTLEQVADLDGDVIFWFTRENGSFEKLQKSPLWDTLKAVKEKRVYQVEWETWMSGLGIKAVNKVVDDLFAYLAKS
ncbi:iron-siderophore ABC transporter substrate-binding protein [Paenibacillus hodogayensis]|uniref:Iron-siderophore ABC transporter substrate-binding protein n=1 Tax=Paenibacillus hodogayensis TaxID=279208 RepID=A0ABV5W298_9BACL